MVRKSPSTDSTLISEEKVNEQAYTALVNRLRQNIVAAGATTMITGAPCVPFQAISPT